VSSERQFAVVLPGVFSARTVTGAAILKSGGDLRTAAILRRMPPDSAVPVLFASRATVEAFRSEVTPELRGTSVDGSFDRVAGSLLTLSLLLTVRVATSILALNFTRSGRSVRGFYSTSNALPDVIVCAASRILRPNARWIAVVHHLPDNAPANYDSELQRAVSVVSFAIALQLILRLADSVVAYHAPTISTLRARGLPSFRLLENSNGVDLTEIDGARRVAGPRRRNVVLSVGRLSPQKGTLALLRIWAQVSKQRPQARLVLIGAEDLLSHRAVMDLVESLGVSETVIVKGLVGRPQLLAELLSARVLAAPSFVEGWGLSVLEGLACGTPVVSWDLPAYLPLEPGPTTVPHASEQLFSDEVIRLLDDDVEWRRKSEEGVSVGRKYSWENIAQAEWALINATFPQMASGS
jgi:glycosyltransferase involved in cell wall biosynthesis